MASSLRPFALSLPRPPLRLPPSLPSPPLPSPLHRRRRRRRHLPPRLLSCRSSTATAPLEKPKRGGGGGGGGGKASIRVRLDHQVAFGESVTLLGSTEELGSWTRGVPMEWTEEGWICEIEIRGGGTPEFKFAVVSGGEERRLAWEDGGNRVLKVPDGGGVFDLVCHWNRTDENAELSAVGEVEDEVVEGVEDGEVAAAVEGELSPFVEQWQGKDVSFMRSNEHGSRESGRRWDTDGLDGVALRLVEGDRDARNWWRKVHLSTSAWRNAYAFR